MFHAFLACHNKSLLFYFLTGGLFLPCLVLGVQFSLPGFLFNSENSIISLRLTASQHAGCVMNWLFRDEDQVPSPTRTGEFPAQRLVAVFMNQIKDAII